jgi:hypothetical protein
MANKISYGLSTVFYWRDLIIGDVTFNGKEIQTKICYDYKSHLWVISNIFMYEENIKEIEIKVNPFIQLNYNNSEYGYTDPDQLYRFIGKVSHIVYLNIDILILAHNCSGVVTNILYQILSENSSKPVESLIEAIFKSKYKL